jgi:glycosyltransferase involved in cell wall biosynthesis
MNMERRGWYPRISVVIPALNEADNLPHVLPSVAEVAAEVILVDGHSTDDTVAVARSLIPGVKIVEQVGKGKGNALRCGFAECTGDILVMMDADGSTNPREIPRFVDALLAGADVAKGSRFLDADESGSEDITLPRRFGNDALNALVSALFQTDFTDLCYGYIAWWRGCLDFFDVDCAGFEVETQINLRARKANLKIVEVPSFERARLHGASHLNTFRDGFRVLRMILQEWVRGYSTVKTPGIHRARYFAAIYELPTIHELPPLYELATTGVSSEGGSSDRNEHAQAL